MSLRRKGLGAALLCGVLIVTARTASAAGCCEESGGGCANAYPVETCADPNGGTWLVGSECESNVCVAHTPTPTPTSTDTPTLTPTPTPTTTPTPTPTATAVAANCTYPANYGRMDAPPKAVVHVASATVPSASTATLVAAPGAGLRTYIVGLTYSASGATIVTVAAGGTTLDQVNIGTNQLMITGPAAADSPLCTAANTVVTASQTGSVTTFVTIHYVTAP